MTNIIVGNMVVGFITVVLGRISFAITHDSGILVYVVSVIAILASILYYFFGKKNYSVKIWQVALIGVINNIIMWVAYIFRLQIIIMLTMGASGAYIAAAYVAGGLVLDIAIYVGVWIPYALICLGIMAGRRKNHEQYEAFVAIEKERKEQRKAYREERCKRDNGEL